MSLAIFHTLQSETGVDWKPGASVQTKSDTDTVHRHSNSADVPDSRCLIISSLFVYMENLITYTHTLILHIEKLYKNLA